MQPYGSRPPKHEIEESIILRIAQDLGKIVGLVTDSRWERDASDTTSNVAWINHLYKPKNETNQYYVEIDRFDEGYMIKIGGVGADFVQLKWHHQHACLVNYISLLRKTGIPLTDKQTDAALGDLLRMSQNQMDPKPCERLDHEGDIFFSQEFAKFFSGFLEEYALTESNNGISNWFQGARIPGSRFEPTHRATTFIARGTIEISDLMTNAPKCWVPKVKVVLKCYHTDVFDIVYEQKAASVITDAFHEMPFFAYPIAVFSKFYRPYDAEMHTAMGSSSCVDAALIEHFKTTAGMFHVTALEDCGDIPYRKFLRNRGYHTPTCNLWASVAQMISALRFMKAHGITHPDLHFGHIMVKQDTHFMFDLGTGLVHNGPPSEKDDIVPMRCMVKIIDWGKISSINQTDFNPSLDLIKFIKHFAELWNCPNAQLGACHFWETFPALVPLKNEFGWTDKCDEEYDWNRVEWTKDLHTSVTDAAAVLYAQAATQLMSYKTEHPNHSHSFLSSMKDSVVKAASSLKEGAKKGLKSGLESAKKGFESAKKSATEVANKWGK